MTPARAIMIAVAVVAMFVGVSLLSRLRAAPAGSPRATGLRIWGTIAVAFGAMLTTFAASTPPGGGY